MSDIFSSVLSKLNQITGKIYLQKNLLFPVKAGIQPQGLKAQL